MTASLNSVKAAQDALYRVAQVLVKKVTFADYLINSGTFTIGKIPALSSVYGGGVHIVTGFNSSGTDLLDVGFIGATTDADAYATDLSLAAVGFLALDELAATTNIMGAVEHTVTGNVAQSVADATAGEAWITVMYATMYPAGVGA